MAALAPMPSASVRMTVIARPLARTSGRSAKRRSASRLMAPPCNDAFTLLSNEREPDRQPHRRPGELYFLAHDYRRWAEVGVRAGNAGDAPLSGAPARGQAGMASACEVV